MNGKEFVSTALRDATVVEALLSAMLAMSLTHGASVQAVGISGTLNFQREITDLSEALALLGVEVTQTLPSPSPLRERRSSGKA